MTKKILIITGASGNIGQAIVKRFLDESFHVIGTVISNDPVSIDITNENFSKQSVDLLNEEETKKIVEETIVKYKKIDAVVATVGGFTMGSVAETATKDILKQYRQNFETAYNIVRPVFLQMIKQKQGRIFLVGSKPGLDAKAGKGMIAYGLAKSLIFRLAELLNDEAKGSDVITSVLVPGTIDTPQNRQAMPAADFDSWVKPVSIADAIYFYCSQEASAIREPVIKLYNNG